MRPLGLAPLPSERVALGDPRLRPAFVLVALVLLAALPSWPQVMVNGDEYLYSGPARTLLHGRIVPQDGDPVPAPLESPGEVLRYPLGYPLLLAPFAALGFRAQFALPILFHLLGTLAFARLLVRRGIGAQLAVVWAIHPAILPWWRLLMTDVPAAALLLLAMDAWEEERELTAGLLLALALQLRLGALFVFAGFGLLSLWQGRWRGLLRLSACGAAGAALLLLGQQLMHGDPLRSAYTENGASLFAARYFPGNLAHYLPALLLLPPFPLLALWAGRGRVEAWALAALPPLAQNLFYGFHDLSPRWLETLIGGQRMLLPALAFLLVATARVWAVRPLERIARLLPLVGALGIAAGALATDRLYRRYQPAVDQVRACHPASVAYNTNAARVALSTDAPAFHLVDARDPAGLAQLVVLAPRAPTNRVERTQVTGALPLSLREQPCVQVGEFWIYDTGARCLPAAARCPDAP